MMKKHRMECSSCKMSFKDEKKKASKLANHYQKCRKSNISVFYMNMLMDSCSSRRRTCKLCNKLCLYVDEEPSYMHKIRYYQNISIRYK